MQMSKMHIIRKTERDRQANERDGFQVLWNFIRTKAYQNIRQLVIVFLLFWQMHELLHITFFPSLLLFFSIELFFFWFVPIFLSGIDINKYDDRLIHFQFSTSSMQMGFKCNNNNSIAYIHILMQYSFE